MILLSKLLENDMHRAKRGEAVPYLLEIPSKPGFVPAVVSSSRGNFLISRKLTGDSRIRTGVFEHDPDSIDTIVPSMIKAALDLSVLEQWPNVFTGPGAATAAHAYVRASSGLTSQPHACLIPSAWGESEVQEFFGPELAGSTYMKTCKLHPCGVESPVFLSRPDFVGMYTQFLGGKSSILLHNVKLGLAFCVNDPNVHRTVPGLGPQRSPRKPGGAKLPARKRRVKGTVGTP